jgi:hypothetical protein
MKKDKLVEVIKEDLYFLNGNFEEYIQFLSDELQELLPHVTKEGLLNLKKTIDEVKSGL